MKIFYFFRTLFGLRLVRDLAVFFILLLAASLTISLVSFQQAKRNSQSPSLLKQQRREILNRLQTMGNVYAFFGENNLDLNLLSKNSLPSFFTNLKSLDDEPTVLPLNFENFDLDLIKQIRNSFSDQRSNLKKQIVPNDIKKTLTNRNTVLNLQIFLETILRQANKPVTLSLFFATFANNPELQQIFFKQFKNILSLITSVDFLNQVKSVQSWLFEVNYAQLLLRVVKLFRIGNYGNTLEGKSNVLLNFFTLIEDFDLPLDEPFANFLQINFGSNNIKQIKNNLVGNVTYRNRMEKRLNSLNRANRLDLELRKHIFRVSAIQLVQQFVNDFFFDTTKPNDLLFTNLNDVTPTKLFGTVLKNKKAESLFQFFVNLLFFEFLIVRNETIPKTFRDFIDAFATFADNFDFRSASFGELINSFNLALKDFFSTTSDRFNRTSGKFLPLTVEEKLKAMPPQELKSNLQSWITQIKNKERFLNEETPVLIDYRDQEKKIFTSGTLEAVDQWLNRFDATAEKASDDLIFLFASLLSKSATYIAFSELLIIDKDNFLARLLGSLISTFLQEVKDKFFSQNLERLKLAKFLSQNWILTDVKLDSTFNQQKFDQENALRTKTRESLSTFIEQSENPLDDFNPVLLVQTFLTDFINWLDFLWKNLLSRLPFLNLNFLFVLSSRILLSQFDVTKEISNFADFGSTQLLYGYLITLLRLKALFLQAIGKMEVDWQDFPEEGDRDSFATLIKDLGYDPTTTVPKDSIFTTNSAFAKLFGVLQGKTDLPKEEQDFLFFLNNKLLGGDGFFQFLLRKIDQYLQSNFYAFLESNSWNYQQEKFVNWEGFLNQKNSDPLAVEYTAKLKRKKFTDIAYRFFWEITEVDSAQKVKLIKIDRIFEE